MLHQVGEKTIHSCRWVIAIAWLTLIASLFYDPISIHWTDPASIGSAFRLKPDYLDPHRCVKIQTQCIHEQPFAMGAFIWWAMIVPAGIFIIFVFGHEFWRRICPLSFMSQIPRALGIVRRRKSIDPSSGEVIEETVKISESSWMGRNYLYVQSSFFIIGLWARLVFVNGDRTALGLFLLATIACSIVVGYMYDGKTWCQYFCPMAPVQSVYTGPRSLLGSRAHLQPKPSATQSMCRTIDPQTHQEITACVGCKRPTCFDIDAEQTYWREMNRPGRRLVQYGYLGMVIAFYLYFFLYAGNWDYYFSGSWAHEETLLSTINSPGFYLYHTQIGIPKWLAVFLTFGVFIAIFYAIGCIGEKVYRRLINAFIAHKNRRFPNARQWAFVTAQQAQHSMYSLFTVVSFWTFFSFGARPTINRLPGYLVLAFNMIVVIVGAIWIYRTLKRSSRSFEREQVSTSLRKQLQQLEIPEEVLQGRSLPQLKPDEVYVLAKALPNFSQKERLRAYIYILQDLLEQEVVELSNSFKFLENLRQELDLEDSDHWEALKSAGVEPNLLVPQGVNYEEHNSSACATQTRVDSARSGSANGNVIQRTIPVQPRSERNTIPDQNGKNGKENLELSAQPLTPTKEQSITNIQSVWTTQSLRIRCCRIIEETPDTKTFVFAGENGELFNYLPGQFATLELNIDGQKVVRPYSISSSPSDPYLIEFTIKRVLSANLDVPPGVVSNWINDYLQVGDVIVLKGGAKGKFTCAPSIPPKLLFISAGSGITPLMSMMRWIFKTFWSTKTDVVFFHMARTPRDIIFRQELEWMSAQMPTLRLIFTITQPQLGTAWSGLVGRISSSMLQQVVPDLIERSVFVCGSKSVMQHTRQIFEELQFPMESYHEESFGDSTESIPAASSNSSSAIANHPTLIDNSKTANQSSPAPQSKPPQTSTAPLVAPHNTHSATTSKPTIKFTQSKRTTTVEDGLKLLEVAEQVGVPVESSCWSGRCGTCKVKVRGKVEYQTVKPSVALTEQDKKDGYVLSCIAYPVGYVEVEA